MGFFLMIILGVQVCMLSRNENKMKERQEKIFTIVFHTGEFGLSSLELLKYGDPCLSPVAFNALPSLTTLTVHNKQWRVNPFYCRITNWLQGLHVLSELNISCKYEIMHKHWLHFYLGDLQPEISKVSII